MQLTATSWLPQRRARMLRVCCVADRGYYNGEEVLAGEGTVLLLGHPQDVQTSGALRGLFLSADFYLRRRERDRYTCLPEST